MTLGQAIRVGWVIALGLVACKAPVPTHSDEPAPDTDDDAEDTDDTTPPVDRDNDGWTEHDGDCNDLNAEVHPLAPELCNGRDDDCDGLIDADDPDMPSDPLPDEDSDGYSCVEDCDDGDAAIHPGASEAPCDGIDSNCDFDSEVAGVGGVTVATLADAFSLARPGDEILLCPGTHRIGSMDVGTVDVVIRTWSGYGDATVNGPTGTVLSGNGSLGVSQVRFGEIDLRWSGELTVEDAIFVNARIDVTHDGASAAEAGVVVRGSTFLDVERFFDDGGAISAQVTEGSVVIEQSAFYDNKAVQAFGGAIHLDLQDASATLSDNVFERNYGDWYAGAIHLAASGDSSAAIANSSFIENTSNQGGAIVAFTSPASTLALDIRTSEFDGNWAYANDGTLLLTAEDASSQLDVGIADSIVSGGISGPSGGAGALHVSGGDALVTLDVAGTEFSGNSIVSYGTFGCSDVLVEATGAAVSITDSTFRDSETRAYVGGACASHFGGTDNSITWSGGSILRIVQYQEKMGDFGAEWVYGGYGALYLGLDAGNTASFDNVAFGTDADANQPRDIWECASNPHVGTITADLDAANPCP